MLTAAEQDTIRSQHPVDVVEQLAASNDWAFDREEEDEISISVAGRWTEYRVAFTWLADIETLHLSCAFDLKAPDRLRGEIGALIAAINEQLWVGHFDIWRKEGVIMHRHGLMLVGGGRALARALRRASRQCAADLRALLSGLPIRALGRQERPRGARIREFRDEGRSVSSASAADRIVFVGAGKMGTALLAGLARAGAPGRVEVIEPHPSTELVALCDAQGFTLCGAPPAGPPAGTLLLAIKPQMLESAAPALAPLVGPETLVVSILAGKRIADLAARLAAKAFVRAMPNTPAAIGRGITGAFANAETSDAQRALAQRLLEAAGEVVWVEREELIDAVTAVSGSGPAYVFLLAECLAAAGEAAGLPEPLAAQLARATVSGAGELLHRTPALSPAKLRENVTSPGGTTAAALSVLMGEDGLAPLMTRAVEAAKRRAAELSG